MTHPGLLSWANSIRLTMASDPGRQVFKGQVQTHGFLFLDDYLNDIVSGGKQDPLIELVKTPGRKKAIARKPKLMSSKLGSSFTPLFEDKDEHENVSPANIFAPPIFARASKVNNPLGEKGKAPLPALAPDPQPPRIALVPIQPGSNITTTTPPNQTYEQPVMNIASSQSAAPVNIEHNNLSIIAEDEEPAERSRESLTGKTEEKLLTGVSAAVPQPSVPTDPSPVVERVLNDNDMTASSTADTFHSIPLDSPPSTSKPTEEVTTDPRQLEADANASQHKDAAHEEASEVTQERRRETLPSLSPKSSQEFAVADVETDMVYSDHTTQDKLATPIFPTLPEPEPIRKSIRLPRDPSLTATMMVSAAPGASLGKRTSWLMKAREANALEGTFKKLSPSNVSNVSSLTVTTSQGNKRKSEDFLAIVPPQSGESERQPKVAKTMEGETAPRQSRETSQVQEQEVTEWKPSLEHVASPLSESGVLDRLKKTVEGLGFRMGKPTMDKSLGGDAATALAEARAAAEARIAERDRKEDEMTLAMGLSSAPSSHSNGSNRDDDRMDISDLFPIEGKVKEKHKIPEKLFQFKPILPELDQEYKEELGSECDQTSKTPANSPPPKKIFADLFPAPVFNKPVFTAPIKSDSSFTKPTFIPPPTEESHVSSSSSRGKNLAPAPLTAHSTLESVRSDSVFDKDDEPAWAPETQDTEYTSGFDSQTQPLNTQVCDEDDSWPLDEKLSAGVQWTFGGKEDSMTWSTQFTQSQRGDTGSIPLPKESPIREETTQAHSPSRGNQIPGAFDMEMEGRDDGLNPDDEELEEIILGKPKFAPTTKEVQRSESQMSMASTDSSQSQMGFLGQAGKLLSSALGTGKKKQPEVKVVLQKAAVAAKKQQEEAGKKAARLKEMENRRQLALQRKAEEEKTRIQEEERKMKEEAERRKREKEKEKEGNTEKRALKLASKKEEESQKKRKIEVEKKSETKKHGSSSHYKTQLKTPLQKTAKSYGSTVYGSLAQAASSSSQLLESSTSKGKGKETTDQLMEDGVSRPTQHLQSQMAARAKAQIEAAKQTVPSESIELPDINSEYSDSEDEDRVRAFDPPDWAQSPELRQALENQKAINPDDIFGAVRPLKMEEIFKTKSSRFRARTSSANWTGADMLTMQEEKEYARRMGFKK